MVNQNEIVNEVPVPLVTGGGKKRGFYASLKSEYLYATKRQRGNPLKMFYFYWVSPTFKLDVLVSWMSGTTNKFKKTMIRRYIECHHNCVISSTAQIGRHLQFAHAVGIIIGNDVKIGDYCRIFQNVTLGQRDDKFPTVGNNVTIYAGAQVLGAIHIGDNATIGANAVVIKDVPANCVAVGVPARIIEPK